MGYFRENLNFKSLVLPRMSQAAFWSSCHSRSVLRISYQVLERGWSAADGGYAKVAIVQCCAGPSPKNGSFKTFVTDCHADSYSGMQTKRDSDVTHSRHVS